MDCRDCPRYDQEARKCRDGKLNPRRYSDAIEVANVWGVRAICAYNDHRPRIVSVRANTDPAEQPSTSEAKSRAS
jgi:hypothetical protein